MSADDVCCLLFDYALFDELTLRQPHHAADCLRLRADVYGDMTY